MDRSIMWWFREHERRIQVWGFVAGLVYLAVGMTLLLTNDHEPPSTTITSWSSASGIGTSRGPGAPAVTAAAPAAVVVAPAPAPSATAGDIYERRCPGTVEVRPGHRARVDASRAMSCAEARHLVRRAVAGSAPKAFTCDLQDPGAYVCTADDGREVDTTPVGG